MPKVKAGTLNPKIDAVKKNLEEKKDSLSAADRRGMAHHLKRLQRKARRIRTQETRLAAATKPKEAAAEAAPTEAAGGDEAAT